MDEFAESRFRLESRHRHVLVDEFQDTSRAQWELVAQLVRNWSEGVGAGADALPPSIFVVADRKQSIYGFRDADVAIVDEAAGFIGGLRTDGEPRRTITVSFRAAPALLAFVNDVFEAVVVAERGCRRAKGRVSLRRSGSVSRVRSQAGPLEGRTPASLDEDLAIGLIAGESVTAAAERVGAEIVAAAVRCHRARSVDWCPPAGTAGRHRDPVQIARQPSRVREGARATRRSSRTSTRGSGFFEADEVQDATALLRYLADPLSDLRAATFLRSRLVRLSDLAIARLAPRLAAAIIGP